MFGDSNMIDESAAVGEVGTDNLNVNKIITIIITIIVGIGGIIMGYIFGRSMASLNTYTIYLSRNMTYTVVETLTRVYKEYIERPPDLYYYYRSTRNRYHY